MPSELTVLGETGDAAKWYLRNSEDPCWKNDTTRSKILMYTFAAYPFSFSYILLQSFGGRPTGKHDAKRFLRGGIANHQTLHEGDTQRSELADYIDWQGVRRLNSANHDSLNVVTA